MSKKKLKTLISHYMPSDENEQVMKERVITFLGSCKMPFGKVCEHGHMTASAWIVDRHARHVLLTHHAKLNKWFQLGGHTEVGETIYEAALREAREESGIFNIQYVTKDIFDIDVHSIPESGDRKEHVHYDIRFLFIADPQAPLVVSDESHDVRWVPVEEVRAYSQSESILRMVDKILKIDIKTPS